MGKGLKSTVTLTGGICLCVLIISVSGRIGSDSYAEKPAEADNRFKNGYIIEKTVVSAKGQKDEDIPGSSMPDTNMWGEDCITEMRFNVGGYTTQKGITDVSQLHHLERLYLSIDNDMADLTPLGNLGELKYLSLTTGCNPDLSFIEDLDQLEELYICAGEEVDLSPLGSLTGLKQLTMGNQDISDLSFLKELDQLEEVVIIKATSGLEDLSCFQDMAHLKRLCISYVDDVDLEYLCKCENLEDIYIVGGNIRNPEGLANMEHLRDLHLDDIHQGQDAFDLSPLAQLPELDSVMLVYLSIDDVSPLAEASSLTFICLAGTYVEDISPLKDLELDYLWIYGNKSEKVKEQAEEYFSGIHNLVVEEVVPENGL